MFKTILYSVADSIATITLNRPDAMNTYDRTMSQELEEATAAAQTDSLVRAVLLQGSGKLFMAGGDIKFFHEHLDTMPKGVAEIIAGLNQTILHLVTMPKPVLASVHGSVAGVGMGLMMACDLVLAAETTRFTTAYSGIGISPDGGTSWLLPRIAGFRKAMELIMLPDVFDAHRAEKYGLINWMCPPDLREQETARLMTRLASGPTFSYAHIKRLMKSTFDNDLSSQLAREGESFADCTISEDFQAGVRAFVKKMQPEFVGG